MATHYRILSFQNLKPQTQFATSPLRYAACHIPAVFGSPHLPTASIRGQPEGQSRWQELGWSAKVTHRWAGITPAYLLPACVSAYWPPSVASLPHAPCPMSHDPLLLPPLCHIPITLQAACWWCHVGVMVEKDENRDFACGMTFAPRI